MRKRDELADPNSCLNQARDDEAVKAAVRAWIEKRIWRGKNAPADPQILGAKAWIAAVRAEQAAAAARAEGGGL